MVEIAKRWMGLFAAVALASAIVALSGCASSGSSASASVSASSSATASSKLATASSGASSASTNASSAVSTAGLANPWSDAVSAQDAAKGAGLETFGLPTGAIADLGVPLEIKYSYMEGMAQARFEMGASAITVRTGKAAADGSYDISGDYNSYAHEWTETFGDVAVTCAGNRKGDAIKAYWGANGIAHSMVAQGLGGDDDFGLSADRLAVFVEAMK